MKHEPSAAHLPSLDIGWLDLKNGLLARSTPGGSSEAGLPGWAAEHLRNAAYSAFVTGSRSTLAAYLHLLVNFPRRGRLHMFLGLVGTNVLMRRALEVADMVNSDDRMIGAH